MADETRVLSAEQRAEATKREDAKAANSEYKPRTAHQVVSEVGPVDVESANERARKAGVTDSAFVDYEEAMQNYESRSDVETLRDRRARENGSDLRDAAFRRQADETDDAVITSGGKGRATSRKAAQK